MSPVIADMAKWKAEAFQDSMSLDAEIRTPPCVRNDLQQGLALARAKLTKLGLPEGTL